MNEPTALQVLITYRTPQSGPDRLPARTLVAGHSRIIQGDNEARLLSALAETAR